MVADYKNYEFLECCLEVENNGTIMCDDYNFGHLPDVKKAIDEFVKNLSQKLQTVSL